MIEVTESSALWQFLMSKMFQCFKFSWELTSLMLELFCAELSPAMFNVTLQLLKLYTCMARSWGWECKEPCMIKLTQYSSWRSRTAFVDDIWNHLLLSLITRIVISETLRRSVSRVILDLAFWYSGTFQLLYDSLSGTMVGVILVSGHKSTRGEFSFIFFIMLSIVFFPIGVFLNHTFETVLSITER